MVEASVKQRMIYSAEKVVLIAESTKLGQAALGYVCALSEVDTLITDESAEPEFIRAVTEMGITTKTVRIDE